MIGGQQLFEKIPVECNVSARGPRSDIKTPGSLCRRSYIKIGVVPDGKSGLFCLASY